MIAVQILEGPEFFLELVLPLAVYFWTRIQIVSLVIFLQTQSSTQRL